MTYDAFANMDIAMLIDYIYSYDEIKNGEKEDNRVRKATQQDIDNF